MESFLSQHGIKLKEDEQKFRSIISNKIFTAGSTIIISYPLASFPLLTFNKFRCDQCLKTSHDSTPLRTCSKCQCVYYCNRSCQKSSWLSHHKWLCSNYTKSKGVEDYDEEMLKRVSILIDKFLNDEKLDPFFENKGYLFEIFFKLMTHRNDHEHVKNLVKFERISTKVHEILKFNKVTKDDLINHLCRFHCNNFTIHDSQLFTYGEGTYPIGSLFNNSCRPNAIVMYDGATQIIKCIQDISIGDEINISYVDVALDRTTRQKLLREKYFFKCQCPRCSPDEQHSGILTKIDQLIEDKGFTVSENEEITALILSNLLPHLKNHTKMMDYINSLCEIISTLLEKNHLFDISSLSSTTKLFYDKIDLKQWNQSTILGKYILSIYLLIYPRYHPIIALHLFTLGKCYWNDITGGLESVKEAINILEYAKNILNITHNEGDENKDVIKQVNDLLDMAKKEVT
ncbi:6194_t:CDS:2 [Funneliformis geosporum]|uniref:568_t:CDS:1 n=1 Tax=Funneliformis geosporum TaxID=1117311 RepID=A0A9W4WN48_9GLOM|nr:6194_t:CDS:2 [Funneliformis geosporum]CAI2174311.1 568_t:CDS:2 [Funneliformis geosporum]